ncbi:MAG: oxygenase MpaB family protein [Segniliparus sp.]|uniref:oxygenase MpaB family protein n=1 Tax=Segniliparus sp. TaxID=2804064 RepID=UPI003F3F29C8
MSARTTQPAPSELSDGSRFQLYFGSLLFALFGAAVFDQVMLPEVAAGVEWTGRVRNTPFERAARTAAADQVVFGGSAADNEATGRWLREAHRAVKGVGFNGVRFSALNPESWNWIMASTILAYQGAYTPITGDKLDDAGRQRLYEVMLGKFEHVQLPGKHARLPAQYSDLLDWYESVLEAKGEHNIALGKAVDTLLRAPFPPFLPPFLKPLWPPLATAVGHIAAVCSFGAMHPKARALTGFRWTKRHDFEFRIVSRVLPVLYARLPKRLTMSPLAYHHWRYTQLVEQYMAMQLGSFAPGCPMSGTSRTQGQSAGSPQPQPA